MARGGVVSQRADQLRSGQLGTAELTASTVANIGPGIDSFSPVRHAMIPAVGTSTLIVPFAELCKPGQPAPYSAFPFIALAIVAAAAVTGCLVVHRHPRAGAGEGAT
jgi:hypothetical protein